MAIVRMEQAGMSHFSSTFHTKVEDGKRRSTARTCVDLTPITTVLGLD